LGVFKDILISYGFPVVFPAWCVCAQEGTVTRQAWDNIDEHDNGVGKALSHSSNPHYVLPPATPATEGHPAPTSKRMWPVVLPQGGVLVRRPPSPQRSRSSRNTNITTTLTTTTAALLRKTRGTHSAAGLTGLPKPAPTLARAVTALHRTMETAALLWKTRGTSLPRGSYRAAEAGADPCEGGDRAAQKKHRKAGDDRHADACGRSPSQQAGRIGQTSWKQGRTEPTSLQMWPVPHPGGIGLLRRHPLAQGPSPRTHVLVGGGSVSRHTRGLGSVGSATPGLMERHWISSQFGCAFPSPKNPITNPTNKVEGGLT
jgi:hypothetical protein